MKRRIDIKRIGGSVERKYVFFAMAAVALIKGCEVTPYEI